MAAEKLPFTGLALLFGACVTLWSLGVMVPLNEQMKGCFRELQGDGEKEAVEKQFRQTQEKWRKLNFGELRKHHSHPD